METAKYCFLIILVLLFGCAKSDNGNLPGYVEELNNLIIITENSESAHPFVYQEDVRFMNPEDDPIGTISGFTVDKNGRVFVGDRDQLVVHVFTSDGRYKGKIGRRGEGPGEFQSLDRIIKTNNETLFVNNAASGNIQLFSLEDLHFMQTIPYNREAGAGSGDLLQGTSPGEFFPSENNSLITSFINNHNIIPHGEQFREIEQERLFLKMNWDGSFQMPLLQNKKDGRHFTFNMGGMMLGGSLPFIGNLSAAFHNNQLYIGHPEEFLIEIYDVEGNYERAFYFPFTRKTLHREEAVSSVNDEIMQEIVRAIDLPETWPAFSNLLVDDENRLWVSTIVENFDIYEWWVLQETGELITRFEWPRNEPIEVVKNGCMYTRETNEETGLQQIVRYRVEMEER